MCISVNYLLCEILIAFFMENIYQKEEFQMCFSFLEVLVSRIFLIIEINPF